MIVETKWELINEETYNGIWSAVNDALTVFSSHTCMEGCAFHANRYRLTAWGFKDACAPLIRSIDDNGEWSFWIARVRRIKDEDSEED